MDRPLQFVQPLVYFAIVTRKSTLQHRVILRITHAKYDRTSLPIIMESLRSFFLDRYVHKQPAFFLSVRSVLTEKTRDTSVLDFISARILDAADFIYFESD
jgi:hypothetical protein